MLCFTDKNTKESSAVGQVFLGRLLHTSSYTNPLKVRATPGFYFDVLMNLISRGKQKPLEDVEDESQNESAYFMIAISVLTESRVQPMSLEI